MAGGGALGLVSAYQIAKNKECSVVVLSGQANKATVSASRAAGAMLNVASEVDCYNCDTELMGFKMEYYRSLFDEWEALEKEFKEYVDETVREGSGMEIRLGKDSANEMEIASFEAIIRMCNDYSVDISQLRDDNALCSFFLPKEQSVDSPRFLHMLETILRKMDNVSFSPEEVTRFDEKGGSLIVSTGTTELRADKLVIACGAYSEQVIKRSMNNEKKLVRGYFGVGSALLISNELKYRDLKKLNKIIRTPNRGGTCGIHAVQRTDSLYVGASSMTTKVECKLHRIESIEALIRGVEEVIGLEIDALSMDMTMGFRPTTVDLCPVIGEVTSDIFALYGTKRDGFTWSPWLGKLVAGWVNEDSVMRDERKRLMSRYSPFRRPISYKIKEKAVAEYVASKTGEYLQHGKILTDEEKEGLKLKCEALHQELPGDFGIHPEIVNLLAANKSDLDYLITCLQ